MNGEEKLKVKSPRCYLARFRFENFDSMAFMIKFNKGYSMTILDMASAFHVINHTISNDGADKIATLDCRNEK